jgi:predicted acetyltransferase
VSEPAVSVGPALESEWSAIERLAQLYQHDLSQARGYLPDQHGVYRFPGLSAFRNDPDRQAWLIRYENTLAGFALTRPWERGGTSMYAFFIVRALRRQGVGRLAALELLARIPGQWGIAFQDNNTGAGVFWEQVARDAVGDRWRRETQDSTDGKPWPDIWLILDTLAAQ